MGNARALRELPWLSIFWCGYAISLLIASTHLTLWLDELIQLFSTRDLSFQKMILAIARDAGQAPIGYLVQSVFLQKAGFSALIARVPSVVCALMACFVLNRLSRLGAVLLALLPLNFRYGCEARPYEMALCFSLLALWTFFKLDHKWSPRWYLAYVVFLTLGLYSQPYSIFPAVGCLAWSALSVKGAARSFWSSVSAISIAGCFYLPWYLYSHAMWQRDSVGLARPPASIHSLTVVVRELVGGGYFQSTLVIAACLISLIRMRPQRFGRTFWICVLIASMAGPIASDFYFGYFLASRQWIFSMPAIAFLASQSSLECHSN